MNRWPSFEEYKKWIYPDLIDHEGPWRQTHINSLLENILGASQCIEKITIQLSNLEPIFDAWPPDGLPEDTLRHKAFRCVEEIAWNGEQLFLLCPSFAKTKQVVDFRVEKDLHKHWDRYEKFPRKLSYGLQRHIKAVKTFISSFYEFCSEGESFLIDLVNDLPENLRTDFATARDLFSVGIEECGGFLAGRGLEAVLREVAAKLKVEVEQKRKKERLREMDFADLGETFRRVRWKSDGSPVIDKKLKALLDFLRSARNATAHPSREKRQQNEESDWCEIAKLSAKAANAIWATSKKGRRNVVTTTIARDW